MIRIDVDIQGEEVFINLQTLPKRLRQQLEEKLLSAMREIKSQALTGIPGKYIDASYVQEGIETLGNSTLIGFVEAQDKPGFYDILPSKASVLRFVSKSGDLVFTKRVYYHPFPKGGPVIERYFAEHKPWLIEQIEDAVFDVVYS